MNRLDINRRSQVVKCLVEGMSLRGTARVTGVARMTIEKLLRELGAACATYQDKTLRNLTCQRIQCDEIWSFIGAKQKNVTPEVRERNPDAGDVWTWTAIDADTKLVISCFVGSRDASAAMEFLRDVASRVANRVQLTTDGHKPYLSAVDYAFGTEIDYAMLVKYYGAVPEGERRYSPAICTGCEKNEIVGSPDPKHIGTSYVERQNLTMRMQMRRFTRLTNAFSKKLAMHEASLALHFMHYNFCQIHGTLRVTPAMAAGVAETPWSVEQIIGLLQAPQV
jgi:IS1 family transposase